MSFFNSDMKTRELKVTGSTGTSGQIEIYDNSSSNKLLLKAPSTITDYTVLFPETGGTTNELIMKQDSNVTLSTHTICSNTFSLTRTNGGTISTGDQSVALDLDKSSDFHYTLSDGSNLTLNNPTNVNRIGQTGSIILETPSSGTTHQLNWERGGSSKWYFPAGIAPSISETNSVIDVFSYLVVASDKILVNDGVNFQQYTS